MTGLLIIFRDIIVLLNGGVSIPSKRLNWCAIIILFCTGLKTLSHVPCYLAKMGPIVNQIILYSNLKFQTIFAWSNHRNPPREWDQSWLIEKWFEPSLQTLMYDNPLLLNLIVLHPLIYVLFHSSTGTKQKLEEEKLLKIGHQCHYLSLMLANCLVLYYHNYPHIKRIV